MGENGGKLCKTGCIKGWLRYGRYLMIGVVWPVGRDVGIVVWWHEESGEKRPARGGGLGDTME